MTAVDHMSVPALGDWEAQLRIPNWGRHIAQVTCVEKNPKWLLELGKGGFRTWV